MTTELAGDARRQALPRRFRWVYLTPLLALVALSA